MGRKGRARDADAASVGTGRARLVVLSVVIAAAVALAVASWRSAPPRDARPAAASPPEREAGPPRSVPRGGAPAVEDPAEERTPAEYRALVGEWVRPDGGYVLAVTGVAADGSASVGYFNPRPINVGRAEARVEDGALGLFVELRDRNYPGSTYTLRLKGDQLVGVYFQALQRASYDVVFVRR